MVFVIAVSCVFYARDYGSFMAPVGLAALYAVTAHERNRRTAWIALGSGFAVLFGVASFTLLDGVDGYRWSNALSMILSIGATVLAGAVIRNKEEIFADTKKRAEQAEADRQAEAERAVIQERLRIAREMHDVVAHGMSLITLQAAAAQEIAHTRPDDAARLMHSVETTGRDALAEMRRMLGVLRNNNPSEATATRGALAPQPSLADLDTTIAHCTHAGTPTELIISGDERPLPPGIELAAFRIVQEALTNVVKHGGDAATATVELRYDPDALHITIDDTGRRAVSQLTHTGSGHGLIGMRERVEIYNGQLAAGPRPGGGYRVDASLPTNDRHGPAGGGLRRTRKHGTGMSIRVAVIDDQALMRDAFTMILDAQPDLEVVGDADNGRTGLELCRRTNPDVALMDIRMPEMDGIEATRLITDEPAIDTKVLVLTTFDLDEYVYAAMRAGASGFLLKDTPAKELAAAVRVIAEGNALLAPTVTKRLIEEFATTARGDRVQRCASRRSHRTRARGAPAARPRHEQPGNRRRDVRGRSNREDPRQPAPHQTRRARPCPGRRPRLRDRHRQTRLRRAPLMRCSRTVIDRTITTAGCESGSQAASKRSRPRAAARRRAFANATPTGALCRRWGRGHRGSWRSFQAGTCQQFTHAPMANGDSSALRSEPGRDDGAETTGRSAGGDHQEIRLARSVPRYSRSPLSATTFAFADMAHSRRRTLA